MQQDCGADPAHASSRGSGEHSQLRIALQRRCKATVRAVHAQGAAPRMELKHICNPGSSMLEFQQSFTVPLQIGVGNGLYTVATQESVLYSQVNQVLGRTGGSYYRAKAAFSVSFIFGGFAR